MCDDHEPGPSGGPGVSRRRVLQGMVALAALAGVGGVRPAAAALPPRSPSAIGLNAYALAMHLHASTSEGSGSMRAQLAQAALNGFDVAWFTEHDWRRRRMFYRPQYHFLATDVAPTGGTWKLPKMANLGSLTTASGGLLTTTTYSPNDGAVVGKKGSLRLRATSTGAAQGTVRYQINADGSRSNFRSRIAGRTVSVDVLPTSGGPDAWGELGFTLSRQPAYGSRPAGVVSMLYRLRTDITTRVASAQGLVVVVDVPVVKGVWNTVALDLSADVGAVWTDLDPRDNALYAIEFHAASRRKAFSEIFFSYLHFDNQVDYDAVGTEQGILDFYAPAVPGVTGLVGSELSFGPHLNQFGGVQNDYTYAGVTNLNGKTGEIRASVVDFIHANGGLASINHPFKPGDSSGAATPDTVARDLLTIGAGGADILEVGYSDRDGAPLASYLAVWDTLSRNGLFLTGNGVSDDHSGAGWATLKNRFYTGAWAGDAVESSLQAALSRGGVYVGYLGGFGGTLDMWIDDTVPMGAVLVNNTTATRNLRIDVTALPTGGGVQVVRGDVDRAGTASPTPNTVVGPTLDASALALSNEVPVDTSDDCFLRLQVVNSAGAVVAFGQPTWVLQSDPGGVPADRYATA
jgi:hypothetical protein